MKTKIRNTKTLLGKARYTNRANIGGKIGRYLDLMNDPRFREEQFRMIEEKNVRSYSFHAANGEMSVHFEINWEGGKA